jgi:hypothetical protein
MATSYTNLGGSGDRSAAIVVTAVGGATPGNFLVDGSLTDTHYWFNSSTGCSIEFWFPGKTIIDEAKFYQSNAASHGTWKWQGSNDRATWTDIGGTFTLGGVTTQTLTSLSGNTTAYFFYRLLQVSGTASGSPYIHEFEFKTDIAGTTTNYLNALGSGNRTSAITVTSSGITFFGAPSVLVNGSLNTELSWNAAAATGNWVQFDLGAAVLVQQARFWLDRVSAQGDWKLQGSPDASAWTDLSGAVTLGATAANQPFVTPFFATANTTDYRYYRLLGVSGSRTNSPYVLEVEFMASAGAAAGQGRVTQDAIELLTQPAPSGRVTQAVVEVLGGSASSLATGRVSQAPVEVLSMPSGAPSQVSQSLVELLFENLPIASRVSQLVTEVVSGVPHPVVSQALVETLTYPPHPVRVTLVGVEVLYPHRGPMRVTELAVEVFYPRHVLTPLTQYAVELFNGAPRLVRATQEAVEVFLTVPPCVTGAFPVDDAPAGGSCPASELP